MKTTGKEAAGTDKPCQPFLTHNPTEKSCPTPSSVAGHTVLPRQQAPGPELLGSAHLHPIILQGPHPPPAAQEAP
jgi:hypothetical protein